jgi:putative transposase
MDESKRMQIGLFRYEVIAPLLSVDPGGGKLKRAIKALARKKWEIPYSEKNRLAFPTIEGWLYAYRGRGFEALKPKVREDLGQSRTITPEIAKAIEDLLEAKPDLTGSIILKELEAHEFVKPGQIHLSNLYRFKKSLNLLPKPGSKPDVHAFAFEYPNDCWQSDLLFGPFLQLSDGKKQRTYLYAIEDDATRIICHAQFYFEQHLNAFKDCLKRALLKRGLPKRLYVDNARVFRSRAIMTAAATLGLHIIHSKPYKPQGRGKVERWFQHLRSAFLSRLDLDCVHDLHHLNQLLWAWVEGEYHHKVHSSLDCSPLDKWFDLSEHIQPLPSHIPLERRTVKKDGTFSVRGVRFEAGIDYVDQKITVSFDPFDLSKVWISSEIHKDEIRAYPVDLLVNQKIKRSSPPEPSDSPKKNISLKSLEKLREQMQNNSKPKGDPS